MPSIRITARGPGSKQYQIQIPVGAYSAEQQQAITDSFREWIKSGKSKESFVVPAPVEVSTPGEVSKEEAPTKTPLAIPPGDVLSLTLPTNGGCSWLLIGSTRSGKSTAMVELWNKYFAKHTTMLMTLSSHADIYKPLAKKAVISPAFFPELVDEAMTINRQTKNHYPFCFIFDDMAMDGKNSGVMTKALTIGRNSQISVIYAAQRLEMMNPTGRTNTNYVCLFRLNTDSAIEDVIKTYLRSYLPPLPMLDLIRLYKEMTADHHFFFVNTLEDTVFHSKISA
jgi:hypothetical protein